MLQQAGFKLATYQPSVHHPNNCAKGNPLEKLSTNIDFHVNAPWRHAYIPKQ